MGVRIWVVSRRQRRRLAWGAALLLGAAAALGGWYRLQAERWTPAAPAAPSLGLPVMIDPGHGGVDGGANWGDLLEKDITLDVGLRLREALQRVGIPVAMTREQDEDLGGPLRPGRHRRDLTERVRRTRECGAVMLVSLHVNASRDPSERGMLFLYRQEDLPSRRLAEALAGAVAHLHPRREPPVPRRNLLVLNGCQIPAVIVELGFLTNAEDRALLTDPEYRRRVAEALALAVVRFYLAPAAGAGMPPHTPVRPLIY